MNKNINLLCALPGGVEKSLNVIFVTGVLEFVPPLPDKHVAAPSGLHARRFDLRVDLFRNKSL